MSLLSVLVSAALLVSGRDDTNRVTGQSGLNVGARLQAMGLSSLLIDRNDRVGDNWRNRYRVNQPQHAIRQS